ncbi:hypothetical protein [Miltoncostaea oceani]|uniref:hypothetical protein n=1 Tax=Miltoncostaea oceani TaxID=2843216 RepID=UPI001C3E5801|nr:hypothetical protein [Miltoncostaea oceani]
MGTILAAVVTALLAASVAAAAAPPSPPTAAGWPKTVPAGTVHQGPGGGVVVVSGGLFGRGEHYPNAATAFRRDGRRLWAHRHPDPACGNCDYGLQAVVLNPDGTYGPLGVTGDTSWAVDPRGREVRSCTGVVIDADGTCISVTGRASLVLPPGPHLTPVFMARDAAGTVLWSVRDPALEVYFGSDAPPVVVRDGAGIVYSASSVAEPVDARSAGRLFALDPASRTLLWQRTGWYQPLAGLRSGLVAYRDGGVAGVGPDGTESWWRALPANEGTEPSAVAVDLLRDRLYVGSAGPTSASVAAFVGSTGVQLWRTAPEDRSRLLSVGRSGRVYVSIGAAGRRGMRAARLSDGTTVWEKRTRLAVRGAVELRNGMVAVSAGGGWRGPLRDRLTLLDPRTPQTAPTTP